MGKMTGSRAAFVLFALAFLSEGSFSEELTDCNLENGKEGVKYCQEAFQEAYEEHKTRILKMPKRTGCCLTVNMGDCMIHAYQEAKCDPEKQEIASLITEQVDEQQSSINKAAGFVGSKLCGDKESNKCGHLANKYDEAKEKINSLNNGVEQNYVTLLAILVSTLVGLVLSRW